MNINPSQVMTEQELLDKFEEDERAANAEYEAEPRALIEELTEVISGRELTFSTNQFNLDACHKIKVAFARLNAKDSRLLHFPRNPGESKAAWEARCEIDYKDTSFRFPNESEEDWLIRLFSPVESVPITFAIDVVIAAEKILTGKNSFTAEELMQGTLQQITGLAFFICREAGLGEVASFDPKRTTQNSAE